MVMDHGQSIALVANLATKGTRLMGPCLQYRDARCRKGTKILGTFFEGAVHQKLDRVYPTHGTSTVVARLEN